MPPTRMATPAYTRSWNAYPPTKRRRKIEPTSLHQLHRHPRLHQSSGFLFPTQPAGRNTLYCPSTGKHLLKWPRFVILRCYQPNQTTDA
jgi:hypothetical protein